MENSLPSLNLRDSAYTLTPPTPPRHPGDEDEDENDGVPECPFHIYSREYNEFMYE